LFVVFSIAYYPSLSFAVVADCDYIHL